MSANRTADGGGGDATGSREVEIKFVITSEDPSSTREKIQGLTEIGGYRLVPLPVRSMRDVYYDTENRALASRRVALRLRRTGGETWITVKGKARTTPTGFLDRLEIELPWSDDALRRILVELARLGVELSPADREPRSASPEDLLTALGLVPIQDRTTVRAARDLRPTRANARSASVGELCLDAVTYRAGDGTVHHHEIEIETRPGEDPAALGPIAEELNRLRRVRLRPWPHDKLVSGLAIEELSARGAMAGLVDGSHHLLPAAYDAIDRAIRTRP